MAKTTRSLTHSEITRFIASMLPAKSNDVSLLYHVPSHRTYVFDTAPVEQVVLSNTPTANVYEAIGSIGTTDSRAGSEEPRPLHTIAFIHRPFALDLRRVPNDLLVLASHTSFDEHLTVGWNPTLAQRLGVNLSNADILCVQGYSGDHHGRVGIIAPVSTILGSLLRDIEDEFGAIEHAQEGLSEEIHVLTIMNTFSVDDVHRVLDMAQEQNWVPSVEQLGRHVLYLTGQVRSSGLAAAKELGMTVVCVGHRVAEQWGIGYMAESLRNSFPSLHIREIYEDELSKGVQGR